MHIFQNTEKNKTADRQIWTFILVYIIIQFISIMFVYSLRDNYAHLQAFLLSLFDIVIAWFPILIIPVIIRQGFKKVLTKKWAIIYTVISAIILLFGDVAIDIYIKALNPQASTTTIWNIIMMIIPYYLLSNSLILSTKNKKKEQ